MLLSKFKLKHKLIGGSAGGRCGARASTSGPAVTAAAAELLLAIAAP